MEYRVLPALALMLSEQTVIDVMRRRGVDIRSVAQAHTLRGKIYELKGNYVRARHEYEQGRNLWPDDPQNWLKVAELLHNTGMLELAVA